MEALAAYASDEEEESEREMCMPSAVHPPAEAAPSCATFQPSASPEVAASASGRTVNRMHAVGLPSPLSELPPPPLSDDEQEHAEAPACSSTLRPIRQFEHVDGQFATHVFARVQTCARMSNALTRCVAQLAASASAVRSRPSLLGGAECSLSNHAEMRRLNFA